MTRRRKHFEEIDRENARRLARIVLPQGEMARESVEVGIMNELDAEQFPGLISSPGLRLLMGEIDPEDFDDYEEP